MVAFGLLDNGRQLIQISDQDQLHAAKRLPWFGPEPFQRGGDAGGRGNNHRLFGHELCEGILHLIVGTDSDKGKLPTNSLGQSDLGGTMCGSARIGICCWLSQEAWEEEPVTIPDSVTSIGPAAFASSSLSSVTMLGDAPITFTPAGSTGSFGESSPSLWITVAGGATGYGTGPIWQGYNIHLPSTVTFDVGGHGIAPADQSVTYELKAVDPGVLTQTGWVFTNWYDSATAGAVFDFSAPITADTVVYARWVQATPSVVADDEPTDDVTEETTTETTDEVTDDPASDTSDESAVDDSDDSDNTDDTAADTLPVYRQRSAPGSADCLRTPRCRHLHRAHRNPPPPQKLILGEPVLRF